MPQAGPGMRPGVRLGPSSVARSSTTQVSSGLGPRRRLLQGLCRVQPCVHAFRPRRRAGMDRMGACWGLGRRPRYRGLIFQGYCSRSCDTLIDVGRGHQRFQRMFAVRPARKFMLSLRSCAMHFRRSSASDDKIRVLFLQSGTEGESIENVHSMLVRQFNRDHIENYVACDMCINGEKTPTYTYRMFEAIPDLHIRPTNFGRPIPLVPISQNKSKLITARNMLFTALALSGSMAGLMRYIKQHRIDIVHTGRYRDMICGVLLAKLTGVKCIVHLHQSPGTWEPSVIHWALRRADGIIAVSQFTAKFAVSVAGCRPERIYLAHNGVDSNRWNPDTDGSSIRREFGIAPDVPVFAIISRLDPSKGHELLLDALHKLKNEVPDFKLLIVGQDRYYMEMFGHSYLEVLNEKVEVLGLSQHVIFTGQRSDVQTILAACDLYTMPSSQEPCAVIFAEAMAMKRAVIALDDGGTPEVVEDGKSGLLSPPQDTQQFAENILTLVNNPARGKQMGEYGRKRVEDYFNPGRLADDVERVYRTVLGEAMDPKARPV